MSSNPREDAGERFWRNPDLIERFLPFLDVDTTLQLARSQGSCALQVIQHPPAWRKLIKRTLPSNREINQDEDRNEIMCLVEILKMMKEPNSYMLDLLKALCEKIPSLPCFWKTLRLLLDPQCSRLRF